MRKSEGQQLLALLETAQGLHERRGKSGFDVSAIIAAIMKLFGSNSGALAGIVAWVVGHREILAMVVALVKSLTGGSGAGTGGGGSTPPATPAPIPVPVPNDPYPDGITLVSAKASHPNHPDGLCHIDGDNVIHPPTEWGTTSFEDGTHFVLEIRYLLGGEPLWFPDGSRLDRTSRLLFRNGSARAVLSATELDGGGFMADGGQIRNRYDGTRGMDVTVKFKAGKDGGPSDGDEPTLEVQAPINDTGTSISETYIFAPFR